MFLWVLSCLVFGFALKNLGYDFCTGVYLFQSQAQRKDIRKVVEMFQLLEERFSSGQVPSPEDWEDLSLLPLPWGPLAYQSLKDLRACGGSVLPTLSRLKNLGLEHAHSLSQARSQSAVALAQAGVCFFLVPLLGFGLYQLAPGIHLERQAWLFACLVALLLHGVAASWLMALAENARWGGLEKKRRAWLLGAQCAGEKFLALLRAGTPSDLAWVKACTDLEVDCPELVKYWGYSVWQSPEPLKKGPLEAALTGAGGAIKKAIQVSLMEGRPCSEKVETHLLSLKQEVQASVQREMGLLSAKALKPLFICVAPAVLGLLAYGLYLTARHSLGGSFSEF